MRNPKPGEANERADSFLIEKLHRREKPVCPNGFLYLILFERRGDERKDVFSQGVFGSGPRDNCKSRIMIKQDSYLTSCDWVIWRRDCAIQEKCLIAPWSPFSLAIIRLGWSKGRNAHISGYARLWSLPMLLRASTRTVY